MTRLFAYGRVSTTEQNTENQLNEITRRGFDVRPTCSGLHLKRLRTAFNAI